MKRASIRNKPVGQIFKKEAQLVDEGKCPLCERDIVESDFKDDLSRREYQISGMCQKCQDNVFGN